MAGTVVMGPVEFEALVRRLGLNPDDHDLDALRAVYLILEAWRGRLERGGASAEAVAVRDPDRPL